MYSTRLVVTHEEFNTWVTQAAGWNPNPERKAVELKRGFDEMSAFYYQRRLNISPRGMDVISPTLYKVVVKRVENLNCRYNSTYNFLHCRDWILGGNADFKFNYVKMYIQSDVNRIEILVPSNAVVALVHSHDEDEEIEFYEYAIIEKYSVIKSK